MYAVPEVANNHGTTKLQYCRIELKLMRLFANSLPEETRLCVIVWQYFSNLLMCYRHPRTYLKKYKTYVKDKVHDATLTHDQIKAFFAKITKLYEENPDMPQAIKWCSNDLY